LALIAYNDCTRQETCNPIELLFSPAWRLLDKPLKLLTFLWKYRSGVIIWSSFTQKYWSKVTTRPV